MMNSGRGLLWAICLYQFGMRAVINVFFVTSQSTFFATAGVTALPYVYTCMNVVYIGLQAFSLSRLQEQTSRYLTRITWLLLAFFVVRLFLPQPEPMAASIVFLLLIMIFDLFFSQFFYHFLNDIFPVLEGKEILPFIIGFGSLSFIVSGFLMKLFLSVANLQELVLIGIAVLLLCQGILVFLLRSLPITFSQGSPKGNSDTDTTVPQVSVSMLGWMVILLTLLNMLGKYWLDYQYSQAITREYSSPKDLAGFIAVYSAVVDALVLLVQMSLAARIFKSFSLVTISRFLPAVMMFFCVVSMAYGSFWWIIAAQFSFTFLAKAFHNSTTSLILGVLPSAKRLKTMGLNGMFASGGAMVSGLTLIAFQDHLSIAGAFGALALVFGLMLAVTLVMERAYIQELSRSLDRATGGEEIDRIDQLIHLRDYDQRRKFLTQLCLSSEALPSMAAGTRMRAIPLIASLNPEDAATLLIPLLAQTEHPKIRAQAARTLVTGCRNSALPYLLDLLRSPETEPRIKADILETLGHTPSDTVASTSGTGHQKSMVSAIVPFLSDAHHRIKAAAATAILRLSDQAEHVEKALQELSRMLDDSGPLPRAAAIAGLGNTGYSFFVPEYIAALSDPDDRVLGQAITALGKVSIPESQKALEDFLAGIGPQVGACRPELREKALRELERLRLLTVEDFSLLLDSLKAEERQELLPALDQLQKTQSLRLLRKALQCEDSQLRHVFSRIVCQEGLSQFMGVLDQALTSSSGGTRFDEIVVTNALFKGLAGRPGELSTAFFVLLEAQAESLFDACITACLRRLWLLFAISQIRLADATSARALSPDIDAEEHLVFNCVAARCPEPVRALEAIGKILQGDTFAFSFGMEYLESSVPKSLAKIFLPFLHCLKHPADFLTKASSHLDMDLTSLNSEQISRLLTGEILE